MRQEDLAAAEACIACCLSPSAHPSRVAWQTAVNRRLKQLLGADKASFALSTPRVASLISEEVDAGAARDYPQIKRELDRRFDLPRRELALGVWSRRSLWAPYLDDFLRGTYYNEFIVPNRVYDTIAATVPVGGGTAAVLLHHERPTGRRFGRRGLALLQLIRPALETGLQLELGYRQATDAWARAVDGLADTVLRFDAALRLRETASVEALRATGDGPLLIEAAARLARELRAEHSTRRLAAGDRPPAVRREATVRGGGATFHLRASVLFEGGWSTTPDVLVSIVRSASAWLTDTELASRFGLTPREREIARALAAGHSIPAIAEKLGLSAHTVRHHAEHAYSKLGAHSRMELSARLQGLAGPEP